MKGENEVNKVLETFEYDQFTILPENRGKSDSKGINEGKIKRLQRIIDSGQWIDECAKVRVNERLEIIDGAHTFEVLRRNLKPIRYEIMHHDKFNTGTKRDKIGAVYSINSVTTSWSPSELFNAAVQCKAPLAVMLNEIIEDNDNMFLWTDLIAILEKDTNYFMGRWRAATMKTFERKDLIEFMGSEEFKGELSFFLKLNLKARIAARKGRLLKTAYEILWEAREMIEPRLMRKALLTIPDHSIQSIKTLSDDQCRKMIIQHYNKSQGQTLENSTLAYALKHKGQEAVML